MLHIMNNFFFCSQLLSAADVSLRGKRVKLFLFVVKSHYSCIIYDHLTNNNMKHEVLKHDLKEADAVQYM